MQGSQDLKPLEEDTYHGPSYPPPSQFSMGGPHCPPMPLKNQPLLYPSSPETCPLQHLFRPTLSFSSPACNREPGKYKRNRSSEGLCDVLKPPSQELAVLRGVVGVG